MDGGAKIALNRSCEGAKHYQETLKGLRNHVVRLILKESAETDRSYLARLRALR